MVVSYTSYGWDPPKYEKIQNTEGNNPKFRSFVLVTAFLGYWRGRFEKIGNLLILWASRGVNIGKKKLHDELPRGGDTKNTKY